MATTPTFYTRGLGNGLPYCPDEVDVTDFDDWITLGGNRKGEPKSGILFEFRRAQSLDNAKTLFYLAEFLKGTAAGSANSAGGGFINGDIEDSNPFGTDPHDRICLAKNPVPESVKTLTQEGFDDSLGLYLEISFRMRLVKMTEGGVFVGYGLGDFPDDDGSLSFVSGLVFPLYSYAWAEFTFAIVSLSSFLRDGFTESDFHKRAAVDLSGISFLLELRISSTDDDFGLSVENRSAFVSRSGDTINDPRQSASVQLDFPVFWNITNILK